VRRHAKASSVGSSTPEANRLGRILRGGLAMRGGAGGFKGSGAPQSRLVLFAFVALVASLALGVAAANAVAPTVTIENAFEVKYTTAQVKGEVNPQGQTTSWRFQFATQADFSDAQDGPSGTAEAGAEEVKGELSGLAPNTTYHLRLLAENSDGPAEAVAASTYETEEVTAPVVTVEDASSVTGTSAHFEGTVDPGGADPAFDSSCAFEYATQAQFEADGFAAAAQIGCDVNPVTGSGATVVQADPTNLQPNTTYHLRLRAENLGGTTSPEADGTFVTLAIAPVIHHTSVLGVTSSQATLHAEISPGGAATTYRFQYMTEAAFEAAGDTFTGAIQTPSLPLPGAADNADHLASATLSGLQADTSYRYQAIATNSAGSTEGDGREHVLHTYALPGEEIDTCPNAKLRAEQHSAYLPDCRAYEMVSPVDKNGGQVSDSAARVQTALDGNAIKFSALEGYVDVRGFGVATDYLSRRGAGGWATHAITPVQQPLDFLDAISGLDSRYVGSFSPDLSHGVFLAKSPIGDTPNNHGVNLYLRKDALTPGAGSYTLLTDSVEPLPYSSNEGQQPQFADADADFSHVLFEDKLNLTQETLDAEAGAGFSTSEPKLYEWVNDGVNPPETRLAGQVPASGDECTGAACVPSTSQAGRGSFNHVYVDDTISRDGSRVVFTAPPFAPNEGSSLEAGALYLRDDQGTFAVGDDTSVKINASELSSPLASEPATFWAASSGVDAQGERVPLRVFFTTQEKLTPNDPQEDANGERDLYMWSEQADGDGHHLTLLSVDSQPLDGIASVRGVLGTSRDGTSVYFAASNQLLADGPAGPVEGSDGGTAGRIFLWREGNLHEVGAVNDGLEVAQMVDGGFRRKEARVSADGSHLAFRTEGTQELLSLYGKPEYDHGTSCPSFNTGECFEIYIYDADANGGEGDLRCASCNPSGAQASNDDDFWLVYPFSGNTFLLESGGSKEVNHLTRGLSDDGHYLFFNSGEALLPQDTNGTTDAYEYDTVEEELHLLSSGTSPAASYVLEATPDGSSAFIRTAEPLVGWDVDGAQDLYDVRVGGGFPEPTPVPAPCAGDQCRGAVSGVPNASGAPTATFSGPGNPVGKHRHGHKRRHKKRHHRHSTRRHG
jgi:hypothetical protein